MWFSWSKEILAGEAINELKNLLKHISFSIYLLQVHDNIFCRNKVSLVQSFTFYYLFQQHWLNPENGKNGLVCSQAIRIASENDLSWKGPVAVRWSSFLL